MVTIPRLSMRRRGSSDATQEEQLPFTNDQVSDADFSGPNTLPRSRPVRAASTASNTFLSSSYTQRAPPRSFAHHASQHSAEPPQYSSQGVRERTEELASYALDSHTYTDPGRRISFVGSDTASTRHGALVSEGTPEPGPRASLDTENTDAFEEESEPESADTLVHPYPAPDESTGAARPSVRVTLPSNVPKVVVEDTETTPLLPRARLTRARSRDQGWESAPNRRSSGRGASTRQKYESKIAHATAAARHRFARVGRALTNPKNYTKDAAIAATLTSLQVTSAVFLGLLLNILDALSYGYILFPLGTQMFSQTGPDGISIFFVSCVVSQLCYSLGLSMFRGGVGSEMIEVVPFFHKMAYSIMGKMSGRSDDAIMATVIVSYCLSSIITGLIFLFLGGFKLGNLVSFFPRHILIGCIGGVGFFLVVTGIEVSARLEGNLNYDLDTLRKLFASDTIYLWVLPLVLAITVLIIRRLNKSPFVLPAFFIAVFVVFYIVVKLILRSDLEPLRQAGWIFEKPQSGVPFYRFYSYFKFKSVDYSALLSTLPTMFALSFFGIIHVPINVPALAAAAKEDNVDVNRELIAHGVSNTLSGCVGSIQNYLVYANSVMFMENGGDSRAAGVLLAAATAAVWMAGPAMIGFIPVCLVGALIFLLGIELLEEAVWDPLGKCHRLEYFTIIAIVLIMGIYDFVVGIFAGIVLACLSYVVQSSRTPAVRASYSGEVAESTVRRPRADRRYLSRVRNQIRVIKLSGFLFFGTIVSVEAYMRSLIAEDNVQKHLTSFIIVDFKHVTDADFSSSEGFVRINRILARKHVKLIVSGVSFSSKVGQALHNVGLFDAEKGDNECPPPQVFEDLNTALEACENELLEAFYLHCSRSSATVNKRQPTPPMSIHGETTPRPVRSDDVHDAAATAADAGATTRSSSSPTTSALPINPLDPNWQSPRRGAQYLAAATTMRETAGSGMLHPTSHSPPAEPPTTPSPSPSTHHALPTSTSPSSAKYKHFSQPLKIMLQTFEGVSSRGIDFWHRAAPYFERRTYPAGKLVYSRGDEPDGFYILERGRFRAEYELSPSSSSSSSSSNDAHIDVLGKSPHVDQAWAGASRFYEVILPGTTCGELPFFSETGRTGTVVAEGDSGRNDNNNHGRGRGGGAGTGAGVGVGIGGECVAWCLTREAWARLEREEPEVGRELVRVGLRLTKERLDAITGYVLVAAS
ncbi:uncharacterized protein EI97DRAFT_481955 [Westerdykella ornata]|uniref:Sulfate transporter family protein-like protein n=1 Tax=Westerdykella ornata TaxID=318751 RepID=A0A6A6JUR2_WESOR|nr:uncharacterized protein EI97DRAFT_481955 [Westerdykella ornata]KAF2279486.1 hypothetical protein EI97DRAFT_481955 [Westerdykella ornata]